MLKPLLDRYFKLETKSMLYWHNFTDEGKELEKISYVPTVMQQMCRGMLTISWFFPAPRGIDGKILWITIIN